MLEYEKLFLMLSNYFQNKGYDFNMGYYWTTFYKNNANHGAHTHHGEHDSRKEINYSSVLSFLPPNTFPTSAIPKLPSAIITNEL